MFCTKPNHFMLVQNVFNISEFNQKLFLYFKGVLMVEVKKEKNLTKILVPLFLKDSILKKELDFILSRFDEEIQLKFLTGKDEARGLYFSHPYSRFPSFENDKSPYNYTHGYFCCFENLLLEIFTKNTFVTIDNKPYSDYFAYRKIKAW